ncbi:MAG: hypothetical protein R3D78_14820 [Paracoccaceae bacterium]|jgi:hypothetical protein
MSSNTTPSQAATEARHPAPAATGLPKPAPAQSAPPALRLTDWAMI